MSVCFWLATAESIRADKADKPQSGMQMDVEK